MLGRATVAAFALWPALLALAWTVPLPDALQRPGSEEIRYADGSAAWLALAPDEQWRVPVQVGDVDPAYVDALLDIEDARFWLHPGVDPASIVRAAGQNLLRGRVVSGASTLTMQIARMSEPKDRTLSSKGVEALRAMQIDLRQPKDRTLGAYLTMAPYGRNIQGVEAASLWMFGHTAANLSPSEIATLLAIPQDPNHRFPSPRNHARLTAARDAIARRLWTGETLDGALNAPAPIAFTAVPRDVPHAASWLHARGAGGARVIATTLDRGVQRVTDRALGRAGASLHDRGIHNGGIIVVEHATGQIRALAGLDGLGSWPGAQIPPFSQPRSPGSTLKPILYALAIDRGVVRPATLVPDVPAHYGTYSPENYDHDWHGMVRMDEALSRSLNVPFVNLLSRFGVESFLGTLRAGGVRHLSPTPGWYGLSAIIGGLELTPLELAQLYTAIAEDGRARTLTVLADERSAPPVRLFSPGAAWLTRNTLRLRDRPDFPSRANLTDLPLQIHWKTGTSFGNRDAWAVGSGARYTVVVWLGNLNQSPSLALVGAESAAPLLFDTLEGLNDGLVAADPAPADVQSVDVCSLSGELPGAGCPHARALTLAGHAPHLSCPLHVRAWVDPASGNRVGPSCPAGLPRGVESLFVQWPANVARHLGDRYRGSPTVPAWAPECAPGSSRGPRIVAPGEDQQILLIPGLQADRQEVALEAEAEGDVVWYVDGRLLGRGPSNQRQWWTPEPGRHAISVMDASGATAERVIKVSSGGR